MFPTDPSFAQEDPRLDSIRSLFETGAFNLLLWSAPILAMSLIVNGLQAAAPAIGWRWNLVFGIASGVVTLVALYRFFSGETGKIRKRRVERSARIFAFPITLAFGLGVGWLWRDHNQPDNYRFRAERAALSACGQLELCIKLAERFTTGDDVGQYIRAKRSPPSIR